MFDDPKKELQKLEQQLLQQEMKEDDFESFYSGVLEEFGSEESKPAVPAAPQQPVKRAAGSGSYADTPRAVAPKKKGVRGLATIVALESVGILALVLYWIVQIF